MKAKTFTIIIISFFLFISCNKDNNPIITEDSFSGITVTDSNGNIISDDSNDWQPRYRNDMDIDSVYLTHAYPNPAGMTQVSFNDTSRVGFIFQFTAPQQAHILITLNNFNKLLYTIADVNALAGQYTLFFDLTEKSKSELPNGIYRVYFEIKIAGNEYTTYGDVEINR